jgi:hypothetical protein
MELLAVVKANTTITSITSGAEDLTVVSHIGSKGIFWYIYCCEVDTGKSTPDGEHCYVTGMHTIW